MKVLDTMFAKKEDMLQEGTMEELYGFDWEEYYEQLEEGDFLNEIWFRLQDVDTEIFIMNEDGETLFLKDGTIVQTCWRGGQCRLWKVEDEEYIAFYKSLRSL